MPGRRGRQPGGGRRRRRRGRPLSAPGEAGAGRPPPPPSSWWCRVRGPRRHLLRLLPLLLLLPAGAEGQAGPSSGPHAAGPPDWPPAGPGPSLSLYLSEEEVRRLIGECGPGPRRARRRGGLGGRWPWWDGGLWGWGAAGPEEGRGVYGTEVAFGVRALRRGRGEFCGAGVAV